jgi:hypothetical protein
VTSGGRQSLMTMPHSSMAGAVLNTIVGAYDRGVVVTGDADAGCALWWFVDVTTAPTKRDAQVGRSVRPGIVGRSPTAGLVGNFVTARG